MRSLCVRDRYRCLCLSLIATQSFTCTFHRVPLSESAGGSSLLRRIANAVAVTRPHGILYGSKHRQRASTTATPRSDRKVCKKSSAIQHLRRRHLLFDKSARHSLRIYMRRDGHIRRRPHVASFSAKATFGEGHIRCVVGGDTVRHVCDRCVRHVCDR